MSKSEKEETGSGAKTNKDRLGPQGHRGQWAKLMPLGGSGSPTLDNPSSIPGTHMIEGRTRARYPLTCTQSHRHARTHAYRRAHT